METSIVPVDYEPLTKNGLLEYKGKKYIVGQGRLGKQATKTENENYFLLTLAGIAKELQYQGKDSGFSCGIICRCASDLVWCGA